MNGLFSISLKAIHEFDVDVDSECQSKMSLFNPLVTN